MTLGRSLSTAALSALMVASLAGPASAAQRDSDEYPAPVLLSSKNVDWVSGSSGWVNLSWTSPVEVKDVQVTVIPRSDGLTIDYPENHDGFTSLFTDSDLSVNEVDFTSFKAETSSVNNGTKWASVYVEYSLSDDAIAQIDDDELPKDGRFRTYMGRLKFSNKEYKGDDFLILTESASAFSRGDGSDNWIEFGYKGLSPMNTDLKVQVLGTDLPIYYPQKSFTSLHHDHVLNAGESDVVRIWLDPDLISPGQSDLEIVVSYTDYSGTAKSTTHAVALTIQ